MNNSCLWNHSEANHASWKDREVFEQMCREHDLTYVMSDYHLAWCRGRKTHEKIQEFAKRLPREVAVSIWNKIVDEKILPDSRSMFYWSVGPQGSYASRVQGYEAQGMTTSDAQACADVDGGEQE